MTEKKKVIAVRPSRKSVMAKPASKEKRPTRVVKKGTKKPKRILTAEGWKRRMLKQ